ncbi:MAG TPA: phosphoglycerate transporter protein PgtP [Rhabdochlamydiaceae bacterium]|nr:phosphoglycerate transporter protein PgtP [Rhabdochlamydiaceae bacterium]
MKWLQIFKPAPVIDEIQDQEVVKSDYKYWRWRIFIGMYVGYVFYYFSRKSFTCVMPLLIQDLGMSKSDLGILGSLFALIYGCSKFLSGVISDRSNPRIFMSIGLMLTGVLNMLFGATSSFWLFAVFWGLNGLFQGWGWPPVAKLLTHWYSQKERGTWWGTWNSSHNVGGAVIPLLVGVVAQAFGWRFGMYVPGLLCIGVGLFVLFCLRDTPASLGLPPIEKFRNDHPASKPLAEDITLKELLFKYVINNGYIWLLGIAYFFVYVIRGAFNDWTPLFLMETRGYKLVAANASIVWFELGGLVGNIAAGWASDKIFKGRRGPINVIFSLAVIGAIVALWAMPPGFIIVDYALIFMIGFLIFGPQMLIGVAAAELSHKKAAGAATGFIGLIAYCGMATAGYPLMKIMESTDWGGFFVTLAICGVVSVLLLIPMWAIKSNPKFIMEEKPTPAVPEEATEA